MDGIYRIRNRALFRFFFRMSGGRRCRKTWFMSVSCGCCGTGRRTGRPDSFEAWMYRIARNVFSPIT